MVVFAFWFIGLILTFKGAIRILNIEAPLEKRLWAVILMALSSWVGLLFYDFYGRKRISVWLKKERAKELLG